MVSGLTQHWSHNLQLAECVRNAIGRLLAAATTQPATTCPRICAIFCRWVAFTPADFLILLPLGPEGERALDDDRDDDTATLLCQRSLGEGRRHAFSDEAPDRPTSGAMAKLEGTLSWWNAAILLPWGPDGAGERDFLAP